MNFVRLLLLIGLSILMATACSPEAAPESSPQGVEQTLKKPAEAPPGRSSSQTAAPVKAVSEAGQPSPAERSAGIQVMTAVVTHDTDGDTIKARLAGGKVETIRMIGVDTPETVHPDKPVQPYGPEASAYTKSQLKPGTKIGLELDAGQRDKYGRLLAYIWLLNPEGHPVEMYNARLVKLGYAVVLTVPPNVKYAEKFTALQTEARQAKRGLWGLESRTAQPKQPHPSPSPSLNAGAGSPVKFDPNGPDRDCGDFSTFAEADAFFKAAGGPARDPHRLDHDHDGVPCESLR